MWISECVAQVSHCMTATAYLVVQPSYLHLKGRPCLEAVAYLLATVPVVLLLQYGYLIKFRCIRIPPACDPLHLPLCYTQDQKARISDGIVFTF